MWLTNPKTWSMKLEVIYFINVFVFYVLYCNDADKETGNSIQILTFLIKGVDELGFEFASTQPSSRHN